MIRVNLKELEGLPALLADVTEKVAQKAIARSLRETIRATRKAAIQAVREASVVKLSASELRQGASEKLVSKQTQGDGAYTSRAGGRFPYFGSEVSKPNAHIADAFAAFRVSDFKINLFRFFARRVRVGKTSRIWDGKFVKPTATAKNVQNYTFSTYGAKVRVLGREYIAGKGFILKRGKAGIIVEREAGVKRNERKPWGRKLWGPSMVRITDGRGVNQRAYARGIEMFGAAILRNLAYFVKKMRS